MALFRFKRTFLSKKQPPLRLFREIGYIVLIPEIGEDLPDNCTLLQPNGLPEFNNVTVEKCMTAIGKQALDFEKGIREIEKRLGEASKPDVFTHIFQPLDILGAPLDTTWGLSKTMYLGNSSLMPTKNYLAIHEHAKRARATKFNCKAIYDASKDALLTDSNRPSEESRVIKKFILEGKLNGLELSKAKKAQLEEYRNKLMQERNSFKAKIDISTKQFKHTITNFAIVRDFPEQLLMHMATNSSKIHEGPWEVTLAPHIYKQFMEHCPNRDLRLNTWIAAVTRGATHRTKDLVTSTHVEEIRFLRKNQANLLGYDTFADMSMETKMAGNVENVRNTLIKLLDVAKSGQDIELNKLYEFAKGRGFEGSRIEIWDVPYWRRKFQKAHFKFDERDFKDFFPLPKVLEGLFNLCKKILNIEIIQRNNVSVWHNGVQFYDIFEDNGTTPIGSFYLDLYAAKNEEVMVPDNGGWMVGIQNRSKIAATSPLAALIFHFRCDAPDKPLLLTFKEVNLLFHKFGHALQHLLAQTAYSEVAGLSNVEWDVVEMCGHVLSHWLHNKDMLRSISSHFESKGPMPDEMLDSILSERKLTAGLDLCRELYLSALDIELHSSKDFWLDIVKRLWPQFRSFPLEKLDSHPCSFTSIFSEDWAAAYYSHVWSRMIAADVYSAFHEVQNDEQQVLNVGKRFRDTFLAVGGSCNPNEVFRKFRGRDPSHKALLRSLGLKQHYVKEERD